MSVADSSGEVMSLEWISTTRTAVRVRTRNSSHLQPQAEEQGRAPTQIIAVRHLRVEVMS